MARTAARTREQMLELILGWPEQGGLRVDKLAEVLAEHEARLEPEPEPEPERGIAYLKTLLASKHGPSGLQKAICDDTYLSFTAATAANAAWRWFRAQLAGWITPTEKVSGERNQLIDRWSEDDYHLALYSDADPAGETFSLWVERERRMPRWVSDDPDAYGRRIQALVQGLELLNVRVMTDAQYRALLDLLMCSDSWPVLDQGAGDGQDVLIELADQQAQARGYDGGWVVAFHGLKLPAEEVK